LLEVELPDEFELDGAFELDEDEFEPDDEDPEDEDEDEDAECELEEPELPPEPEDAELPCELVKEPELLPALLCDDDPELPVLLVLSASLSR
jgi:hypothetical protein